MTISDYIEREHVIRAIQQIDKEGFECPSTGYDLIYERKTYPPKEVIRLAYKLATGEELERLHGGEQTNNILKELGFFIVIKISLPKINKNLSIEQLAQIYRDIEEEKTKTINPPIVIPSSCNVIPASEKGLCKDNLVGIIIDKKDFERRMPKILASFIRCKHQQVLLASYYWDGKEWENIWREPFKAVCEKEAVGSTVYRQMYDGFPERIL